MKKENKFNLFSFIRMQIIKNELEKQLQIFKFTSLEYPEQIMVWLIKSGVFEVVHIKRIGMTEKGFVFEIMYKNPDFENKFLKEAFGYEENKLTEKRKYDRKRGYGSNEPVTVKMLKIYDEFREELECPNYSNEPYEDGYIEFPDRKHQYEKLSLEDNCCLELILNDMGYKNYEEFAQEYMQMYYGRKIEHEELNKYYPNSADSIPIEIREVLSMEIENFYRNKVKDCETV